ncbi:hypothetical protein diail_5252 [Diaporthe ilicicola]|nr:hypothetical protein diail_5252 [Diaporthe ilicicola]
MRPPQVLDPHPRHPREDLHRFVNGLNVKYSLGVPIPDPGISPSKRKEQQTPATRLYTRLEVHFYQGGLETLQQLTNQFDAEARQSWSQWVKKPGADPDTIPTPGASPLASNQLQREALQSIFLKVLDRSQPKRAFSRTQSGPASFSMEKFSSASSKRAAEADTARTQVKRSKAAGQAASAAQDSSPAVQPKPDYLFAGRGTVTKGSQQSSTRTADSLKESFEALKRSTTHSASTSGTSFRSIFSKTKVQPGTQDTLEVSAEGQIRAMSPSQDVYTPTSTMVDALHTSFHEHEASFDSRWREKGFKDAPYPPTETTDYPSSAILEALPSSPENQARIQAAPAVDETLSAPESRSRLAQNIWPALPDWLEPAPFHIVWEVLRIGSHMGVDLNAVSVNYSPDWDNQENLRKALGRAFPGKPLPAASDSSAWTMATRPEKDQNIPCKDQQHVVFTASLEFASTRPSSPLCLKLKPLKLDRPHRLGRKYGANRFLELLVPSPDRFNLPLFMKDEPFYDELVSWLTQQPHAFCGRRYRPFYLKSGGQRTPLKHLHLGPDPKPVYTDRIFLFAEDGIDLARSGKPSTPIESMISWALNLRGGKNHSQPVLKLFQRLALVLSRTIPTIVFEPDRIKHRAQDLLSPDGKRVMNDGVARMSKKAAKMIQQSLGLTSAPCAVQGRIGSAKGMWIIDVTDTTEEIWIETYPSQRKWDLAREAESDQEHRTLEIRSWPPEKLRSANLNLQFLPVLEDRAIDKQTMRKTMGYLLKNNLQLELKDQKQSLKDPIQFQKWISANSAHRQDRRLRGYVPFQGGLPQEDEEIMACMLNAGFDPLRNKFLNKMAYDAQFAKCEKLSKKLNIKVGRSAYLLMVVDFLNILKEGEVHIAFADRFRADVDEWEGTMVHGVDVLVARSPAHFTSDIQRVKAVFKPELSQLQNVIVFSAKGDIPLADKLSGGDYDGDMCFCTWDDRVVSNFTNAEDQAQPDLSEYFRQDKIQLQQLLSSHGEDLGAAIDEMIEKCFAFNLTKDMLGQATNYKERLCYSRGNVRDEVARKLSALLSILVDSAKQGIEFNPKAFEAFKQSLGLPGHVDEPLYKKEHRLCEQDHPHIIDYLKCKIALPTIKDEMSEFNEAMGAGNAYYWDKDLSRLYDEWEHDGSSTGVEQTILISLKRDIENVLEEWNRLSSDAAVTFSEMVQSTYGSWQGIQPNKDVPETTLTRLGRGSPQISEWALLKASTTFKLYYKMKPRFAWQMAGWHLCYIKWQAVSEKDGVGRFPAVLTSSMFAITKTDSRVVNHLVENQTGLGTEGDGDGDEEDDV